MLKLYCIFAAVLLTRLPCQAQAETRNQSQAQSFLILKGIIVDDSTGEGLPFATLAYPWNGINSMSNERAGSSSRSAPIKQATASIFRTSATRL